MKNFLSALHTDNQLKPVSWLLANLQTVTKNSGTNRWWVEEPAARRLLAIFGDQIDYARLNKREIDGQKYYALYFGASNDLRKRFNQHLQKTARQSTLRHTLKALLSNDSVCTEDAISQFFCDFCYCEWVETKDESTAKEIKMQELSRSDKYYPLNILGNKAIPAEIAEQLSSLRNQNK